MEGASWEWLKGVLPLGLQSIPSINTPCTIFDQYSLQNVHGLYEEF